MGFQTVVNRNYTTGFAGEIVRDGPLRAIPARIVPPTVTPSDGRSILNTFSRAFGYSGEVPVTGTTLAALMQNVEVGGDTFAGILIHPKHHVLNGSPTGGSLAPYYSLPNYTEAEFASMAIIVAEIFNQTTASVSVAAGDNLAYISNTASSADTTLLPLGALVSYKTSVPAGCTAIPNAKVKNAVTIAASAVGTPVSTLTIVSLTQ